MSDGIQLEFKGPEDPAFKQFLSELKERIDEKMNTVYAQAATIPLGVEQKAKILETLGLPLTHPSNTPFEYNPAEIVRLLQKFDFTVLSEKTKDTAARTVLLQTRHVLARAPFDYQPKDQGELKLETLMSVWLRSALDLGMLPIEIQNIGKNLTAAFKNGQNAPYVWTIMEINLNVLRGGARTLLAYRERFKDYTLTLDLQADLCRHQLTQMSQLITKLKADRKSAEAAIARFDQERKKIDDTMNQTMTELLQLPKEVRDRMAAREQENTDAFRALFPQQLADSSSANSLNGSSGTPVTAARKGKTESKADSKAAAS